MDLRVAVAFDFYHPSRDLWLDCRLYPTPQGLSVFTTDITQRKRAEEKPCAKARPASAPSPENWKPCWRLCLSRFVLRTISIACT